MIGTRRTALKLKLNLTQFLKDELKLELSPDKTKITNLTFERARFLGVYFWVPRSTEAKMVLKSNPKAGRFLKTRINQTRVYFAAPIKEILQKLEEKGLIKRYDHNKERLIPNAIPRLIFLNPEKIILRYNSIIHGYLNYFSFVDNRSKFNMVVGYILRHSCAKTLARKYHLGNRAGAFQKFGKNLEIVVNKNGKIRKYSLSIPETLRKTRKFKIGATGIRDPLTVLNYKLETTLGLGETCSVCGSIEKVEMHHVRHLRKDSVEATGFTKLMSKLNRKQLPVCRPCHMNIHKGLYNGMSLNEL